MLIIFTILALLTLAGAIAALSLRNLVHCALALTVAFAGLAAIYLQLSAQFVGFAQILVYVGAVAILIVFAILLTRSGEPVAGSVFSGSWIAGVGIAAAVFAVLTAMIRSSRGLPRQIPQAPQGTVREIGDQMMSQYVLRSLGYLARKSPARSDHCR